MPNVESHSKLKEYCAADQGARLEASRLSFCILYYVNMISLFVVNALRSKNVMVITVGAVPNGDAVASLQDAKDEL